MRKTLSEKQLTANRANALKSTGPKTPGGKYNSSRNAITHGVLASTILLPGESRDEFFKLIGTLINEFQPADTYEMDLVRTMAVARWRTFRIWSHEAVGLLREQRLQLESATNESASHRSMLIYPPPKQPRSLEALSRWEVDFDLVYHRAADRLVRLREKRQERGKKQQRSHHVIENTGQWQLADPIRTIDEASSNRARTVIEPEPCLNSNECAILNQDKISPSSC